MPFASHACFGGRSCDRPGGIRSSPDSTFFGIALGITVFLAVQIANRGAIASFEAAAELATGRANLEVRGDLDDGLLPAVAAFPGVQSATPIVRGIVTFPDVPGEYLRILGCRSLHRSVRLFPFQLGRRWRPTLDLEKWLSDPEAIALQRSSADPRCKRPARARRNRHANPPSGLRSSRTTPSPDGSTPRRHGHRLGAGTPRHPGRLSSILILLADPPARAMSPPHCAKSFPPMSAVANRRHPQPRDGIHARRLSAQSHRHRASSRYCRHVSHLQQRWPRRHPTADGNRHLCGPAAPRAARSAGSSSAKPPLQALLGSALGHLASAGAG